jgi:hypothetical protein
LLQRLDEGQGLNLLNIHSNLGVQCMQPATSSS